MNVETLKKTKLKDLQKIAEEKKIINVTKMRKDELIAKILEIDGEFIMSDNKILFSDVKNLQSGFQTIDDSLKEIESNSSVLDSDVLSEKLKSENSSSEISPKSIDSDKDDKSETKKTFKNNKVKIYLKDSPDTPKQTNIMSGVLEVLNEGYGFLRSTENYQSGSNDVYVSATQIKRFNLKTGDYLIGNTRMQYENEKFEALIYVQTVNGDKVDAALHRTPFDLLVPVYPSQRIILEIDENSYSMDASLRIIDLIAPIGKGQRGIIVAPPKAGKTTLLKQIANSISRNHPEVKLIVLLIDERPEEVTDMKRNIKGEVIYSTFDEESSNHIKVAEIVLERAKRLVEHGKDVIILLDSITRLTRAYNLTISPTGRTLSGGLDPGALYKPKRFFGAARNIEGGGSLTILATALVETGSRMDDLIFEEFKGTGNMEIHLDRKLQERRIFPSLDISRTGTRKEELLVSEKELHAIWKIRRLFANKNNGELTETIIKWLIKTKNNEEFIDNVEKIFEN